MSGTSLDGIDCTAVRFTSDNQLSCIGTYYEPYSQEVRIGLSRLISNYPDDNPSALEYWHNTLGELYTQCVINLMDKCDLEPDHIHSIGCHGQTIAHQPNDSQPFSLQIGNALTIKQRTGIPVVCDFRNEDIQDGGQGAPLAPIFHDWYFRQFAPCAVVNIGGIANISIIHPKQAVRGWDTGPGNTLLDSYYQQHHQANFDKGGLWAKSGVINHGLLQTMIRDPYFGAIPPKSTGTDYFNSNWLAHHLNNPEISPCDVQATLTALTAQTITSQIHPHLNEGPVFVCGGGVHNQYLMHLLQQFLGGRFCVKSTDKAGIEADWLEAICFAWLAWQRTCNVKFDLKHLTGSHHPHCIGNII